MINNADKAETNKSKDADKQIDAQKTKDITSLLRLDKPKIMANKSSSEDEGLGQAFDEMLRGEQDNLKRKGSISPLPPLGDDENDSGNEVD